LLESLPQLLFQYLQALGEFLSFDPALLNQPEMIVRLALQVLLLLGSAFFAGSETALFSLSRLDLQQLRRQHHAHSATLHALLDSPRRLIISILCGNQVVNIAAVANATSILVSLYGQERAGLISVLVMVPLLLLFGEITPKTIAVSNPVRVSAGLVAAPMSLWVKLVAPLRWAIRGVAERLTTWIVGPERAPENILQLDEFLSIVDQVANEGELRATERSLIYHLLEAGTTEVVHIMTPRTRVDFIDVEQSVPAMVEAFRERKHSRVPVFRGQHDNIVGFLHIEKILPLVLDKVDLAALKPSDILSRPVIVPLTKKVDEMFDFFKTTNARAALVMNEFGGVEGLVTMRDVLTFIFGHLSGEIEGQALYEERDENVYEVPGEMKLVDFNNLTNFGIEDPRMTTIGGVLFRHLDRLPQAGDEVKVEDYWMTVLEVEHQRITRVRVALGDAWREREAPAEGATEADQEAVQQAEVSAEEATPDNGNAADRPAREG
jgi:CBS domain containing-hemolysin-like protein